MNELFSNNKDSIVASERVLYTPSLFAKNSLMYLQEIGELTAKKRHTSSRSSLSSFLFFFVEFGSGKLIYNGKEFSLNTGDCVFIDCEESYSHTTDQHNLWSLKWIHFYGFSIHALYDKYCERGGRPVFKIHDLKPVIDLWSEIYTIALSDDYIRDMRINESLNSLFTILMENSWNPKLHDNKFKKKSIVVYVKKYLDQNYTSKITLDDLSSRFYINKYYLIKMFKMQYDISINNYILNLRITRAKKLLRFTDKTIEEIGYECGLGTPQYFSAKFKEVEGIPPSLFRERW